MFFPAGWTGRDGTGRGGGGLMMGSALWAPGGGNNLRRPCVHILYMPIYGHYGHCLVIYPVSVMWRDVFRCDGDVRFDNAHIWR